MTDNHAAPDYLPPPPVPHREDDNHNRPPPPQHAYSSPSLLRQSQSGQESGNDMSSSNGSVPPQSPRPNGSEQEGEPMSPRSDSERKKKNKNPFSKENFKNAFGKAKDGVVFAAKKTKSGFEKIGKGGKKKDKDSSKNSDTSTENNNTPPSTGGAPLTHPPPPPTEGELKLFGVPLGDVIARAPCPEDPSVPELVYRCIQYIGMTALTEEGIFRLSGSSSEISKLKAIFCTPNTAPVDLTGYDSHAVTGLLKSWFRELPESIFVEQFFASLGPVYSEQDPQEKINKLRDILMTTLPQSNYGIVRYLFLLLGQISQQRALNKMGPNNLAIVFSPTLKVTPELCQYLVEQAAPIFE
jgi:hypothetical protein